MADRPRLLATATAVHLEGGWRGSTLCGLPGQRYHQPTLTDVTDDGDRAVTCRRCIRAGGVELKDVTDG